MPKWMKILGGLFVLGILGQNETLAKITAAILATLLFASPFLFVWWMLAGRRPIKQIIREFLGPRISPELKAFSRSLTESKAFTQEALATWKHLINQQTLSTNKINKFKAIEFARLVEEFAADRKLNDREWEIIRFARNFYDHDIPSSGGPVNLGLLRDWRARGIVSEGRLIEKDISELPVKAKPNERLFLIMPAVLVKRRKVTTRVNYSGVTGSIKLGGGFRYRVGSIQPQRVTQEHLTKEDIGLLWVTNERCGFHGDRKSWSMSVDKMSDIQVENEAILEIFKDGRENPILIMPADVDHSCAVLSLILNEEYGIDSEKAAI